MTDATMVLVHGAWHGSWAWDPLRDAVQQHGVAVTTVDLPSVGGDAATRGSLPQDAEVVRAALDAVDGPVVLVGHSYGGMPLSQAGDHDAVRHLVYVCAFMLDVGESLQDALGGEVPDWFSFIEDGAAILPQRPHEVFYGDVPPAQADACAARLQPQSAASFGAPLTAAAWHDKPSTYVICEQDRAIPPPAQEQMAQRAGTVHRLAASHSPFLSRPADLVQILLDLP